MLEFARRCGLVFLQLTFSYAVERKPSYDFLRKFAGAAWDPENDREHARHEVQRRHLGTLDHQSIASRFFSLVPSLEFLGLSLHADGEIEHWVANKDRITALNLSPEMTSISRSEAVRRRWEDGMGVWAYQRFSA